jgi:hypothetical protein
MRAAQPWIVDAVARGDYVPLKWSTIELPHSDPNIRGWIEVASDALSIGRDFDSVRPIVSHRSAQAIADLLDLRLLTPRLVDRIARQADIWIEPLLDPARTSKASMVTHSVYLDARIPASGLVAGVGKQWVTSRRLERPELLDYGKSAGINYGLETRNPAAPPSKPGPRPSTSEPTIRVWQTVGGKHNVDHLDNKQTLRLARPWVTVETYGITTTLPLDLVAVDPLLSELVSHEGPVLMRHPWLGACTALAEGGTCPPGVLPLPGEVPPGEGPPPVTLPVTRAKPRVGAPLAAAVALGVVAAVLVRYTT